MCGTSHDLHHCPTVDSSRKWPASKQEQQLLPPAIVKPLYVAQYIALHQYQTFQASSTSLLSTTPHCSHRGQQQQASITAFYHPSSLSTSFNMTRTHKVTDRDHVGLANGTAAPSEHLPRYFGKAGHSGDNPSGTKKQGGGKGNWGKEGTSELEDYQYNMSKARRRTNSFSAAAGHNALKTKFEAVDEEAIEYDEYLHGPAVIDEATEHELEKMSTSSSAGTMASVEEEDAALNKQK